MVSDISDLSAAGRLDRQSAKGPIPRPPVPVRAERRGRPLGDHPGRAFNFA